MACPKYNLPQEDRQVKSEIVRQILLDILESLARDLLAGRIPTLRIPARTKNNIIYDPDKRIWVLGEKTSLKTCKTIGGSKEVLRLTCLINALLDQLKEGKKCTLRNMYYVAMTWIEQARFEEVGDTANAMEHLECITGLLREQMGLVPDHSGSLFGDLVVDTKTRAGRRTIHCANDVSESGFSIPPRIEDYDIVSCNAKFILVLETGGIYQRLIDDRLDQTLGAALVHTKGHSSRATRLCLGKIRKVCPHIPIISFHDGDVWGLGIMENIASGSIKSSHLAARLCTPDMVSMGLFPSQIIEYGLPTVKITARETKRILQVLEDPRYLVPAKAHLLKELQLMNQLKIKAEQQSLAAKGLSFVTDVFIPKELRKLGVIS